MQKILNKLAKTNKRSTSVKKVNLAQVDDLTQNEQYISELAYTHLNNVFDLADQMEEQLGFLAGLGDLAQESMEDVYSLEEAIKDLGIDMPDDIAQLKLRFTILKDLKVSEDANEHLQRIKIGLELFRDIV
jgi:uncharacterized protein YgfB (UPF0149 family)